MEVGRNEIKKKEGLKKLGGEILYKLREFGKESSKVKKLRVKEGEKTETSRINEN